MVNAILASHTDVFGGSKTENANHTDTGLTDTKLKKKHFPFCNWQMKTSPAVHLTVKIANSFMVDLIFFFWKNIEKAKIIPLQI